MIRQLKRKFIATAMLAVSLLLIVLLGVLNGLNVAATASQSGQLLESLAREEALPMPGQGRLPHIFAAPPTDNERRGAAYFSLRVSGDGVILRLDLSRIENLTEREAIALAQKAADTGKAEGYVESYRFLAVSAGPGEYCFLFLDVTSQRAALLRVGLLSFLAGAVCWAAMLLLVMLLSKRAIRPIAENLERQRQFVTDAGHELKTPLAIIQANTEVLELHQGKTPWSRTVLEQVGRMTMLTNHLLTLARAEAPEGPPLEAVELSELLQSEIEQFFQVYERRELTLKAEIPPGVTVRANREQIRSLAEILLDNGAKYALPGTEVTMTLEKKGREAVLTVKNRCEKRPDCKPESLFRRFYRPDSARTQSAGGHGIGLAAAQAIVTGFHGKIGAAYWGEDGISFTVTLPLE